MTEFSGRDKGPHTSDDGANDDSDGGANDNSDNGANDDSDNNVKWSFYSMTDRDFFHVDVS